MTRLKKKIVELLNERSEILGEEAVSMIDMPVNADVVDRDKVRTPELYLGYGRSQYLASVPSDDCTDKPCDFVKSESVAINTYAFDGKWNIGLEASTLVEGEGEIIIRFSANKVNLVAGTMDGDVKAEILLDGKVYKTVNFSTHDLYNVVDLGGDYGEHELIIRFLSPGIQAFAFTFG